MTPKFAMIDVNRSKRPDGVYVEWEKVVIDDEDAGPPDEKNEGFWPSQDPDDAGYVEPDQFEEQQRIAEERMRRYNADQWCYVGVRAKASIMIVKNGVGFMTEIESAGLWGIESDSELSYFDEVFEEEKETLKDYLKLLAEGLPSAMND